MGSSASLLSCPFPCQARAQHVYAQFPQLLLALFCLHSLLKVQFSPSTEVVDGYFRSHRAMKRRRGTNAQERQHHATIPVQSITPKAFSSPLYLVVHRLGATYQIVRDLCRYWSNSVRVWSETMISSNHDFARLSTVSPKQTRICARQSNDNRYSPPASNLFPCRSWLHAIKCDST